MSRQNKTIPSPTTHKGLYPADVVRICRNLIFQNTNKTPTSVETAWLVERVFNRLFPELHAWRAVTHACAASPDATKIFQMDINEPQELLIEKLRQLPTGSIRSVDANIPIEQLGTFDKIKGRHLGHVCLVVHAPASDQFYFLDPEPWDMEHKETGIIFDELIMFTIEAGIVTVSLTLQNGASVKYLMYPTVPPPNPAPDILPILEKGIDIIVAHFAVQDEAFMKSIMSTH